MKRRNQANHKEEKFRESKYLWYELREKPKPQTRPLIRIIAEITISSHTGNHPSSFFNKLTVCFPMSYWLTASLFFK